MRIAYVINSVEGGGAAAPVPDIARVLQDQGAAVRVFALTRRDGRALPPMVEAGLDPLVRPGGLHDHVAALRWLDHQTRAWGATLLWTSLTRATVLGLLLARRRALPAVCWQHAAFLKTGNRLMLRALQSRARLWVADSTSVAALTHRRLKVPAGRLLTWPIFAANPDAPTARPWMPGEALRLGSLGRLHPVKGYNVLLDALVLLKRQGFQPPAALELTIAGEGRQRAQLEAQITAGGLGGMVRLPGFSTSPLEFLAGLHLYLQPSRSEGFCIAAHQAMQAGLPVLASAVGEMPHTIENGISGLTVPPLDAAALAAGLHGLLSRPEDLHRMGTAARTLVLDRFSRQNFVAAGTAVLDRVRS